MNKVLPFCLEIGAKERGHKKRFLSRMEFEKYTERSRGFIQSAQGLATRSNHQQLTPLHLLKVLLDDKDALAAMERRAAASTIKIHGLKHEMLALEDVLSVTAADVASLFKQAGRLDAELNEMVYTDTDEFVAHPSRNSV